MKVSKIGTEDLAYVINGLNNKIAWDNPSIFMGKSPQEGSSIDNNIIFKQIYGIEKE